MLTSLLPANNFPGKRKYNPIYMKNTSLSQRKCWIDWMKAIGILVIVWGHAFPEVFTPFIYSFSVPLFFLVAGFLFKPTLTLREFFSKNFFLLIVPYLLLCLIKDFSHFVKYYDDFAELIKCPIGVLGGFHTFMDAPAAKNLWFVYSLFILKFVSQLAKGNVVSIVLSAVACVVGACVCDMYDYHPKWAFTNALLAMPYFAFGYLMSRKWKDGVSALVERIKSSNKVAMLMALVVLACVLFCLSRINGPAWMYAGEYGNNMVLFYLLGLAGSFMVFVISVLLDDINLRPVGVISIGTIVILQFHRDLYYPLGKIVKEMSANGILEGVYSFIASLLVVVAFIPVIMLLQRYFPLLIGNRKCK